MRPGREKEVYLLWFLVRGRLTTVVMEMPRVAACSSEMLSGVWIWRSPLTAMYLANVPSSFLSPFLRIAAH